MHQTDWAPLIAAIAALVAAATPAVVGLLVALSTHVKVARIEVNTNGKLDALVEANKALSAEVAGRRAADKGGGG